MALEACSHHSWADLRLRRWVKDCCPPSPIPFQARSLPPNLYTCQYTYTSDSSTKEAQNSSSKRLEMASGRSQDILVRAVKAELSRVFEIVGHNVKSFRQNLHATAPGTINQTLVGMITRSISFKRDERRLEVGTMRNDRNAPLLVLWIGFCKWPPTCLGG